MNKNQKGFAQVLLILGIVAALAVIGFVLYKQNTMKLASQKPTSVPEAYQTQYQESADSVAPVENTSDLTTVSTTIDTTDTTQMDADLDSLSTDLSSF